MKNLDELAEYLGPKLCKFGISSLQSKDDEKALAEALFHEFNSLAEGGVFYRISFTDIIEKLIDASEKNIEISFNEILYDLAGPSMDSIIASSSDCIFFRDSLKEINEYLKAIDGEPIEEELFYNRVLQLDLLREVARKKIVNDEFPIEDCLQLEAQESEIVRLILKLFEKVVDESNLSVDIIEEFRKKFNMIIDDYVKENLNVSDMNDLINFFNDRSRSDEFLSKLLMDSLEEVFVKKDISYEEKEKNYDDIAFNFKMKVYRCFEVLKEFKGTI